MRTFYTLYMFTFYMKIMYMVDLMHILCGTIFLSNACYGSLCHDTSKHKKRTFNSNFTPSFEDHIHFIWLDVYGHIKRIASYEIKSKELDPTK